MLKALGYPVLAVGVVMGLQTFIPTSPAPFVPAPVDKAIAVLPPKETIAATRPETAIVPPKPVLVTRAKLVTQTAVSATASAATVTVSPWRTAVVSFEGTDGAQSAMTSVKAATSADRYELARNIQRELKRVGCYYGAVDGSWGSGSKRALTTFMERVNASLPIKEPDYILLALIRAQPAAACSVPCPAGQAYAGDGRCVPNAILAQATRKSGVTDSRTAASTPSADAQIAWTAEVRPSAGVAPNLPPPAPLLGRMSIGGPRPDAAFGDTAANGPTDPARSGAYTTASLTGDDDPSSANDAANFTPQVVAPAAPRVAKASKPVRRSGSRTRSVHQLFMHPLGRM